VFDTVGCVTGKASGLKKCCTRNIWRIL